MTCPFKTDKQGNQQPCSGDCQLYINGKCAITDIAIALLNKTK